MYLEFETYELDYKINPSLKTLLIKIYFHIIFKHIQNLYMNLCNISFLSFRHICTYDVLICTGVRKIGQNIIKINHTIINLHVCRYVTEYILYEIED